MRRFIVEPLESHDLPSFFEFIGEYWAKNHILTTSRDLFFWQYENKTDDNFNFVIAKEVGSSSISGILGFIPPDKFSSPKNICWLTVWRVDENRAPLGLGLRMLNYVKRIHSTCLVGAMGLSDVALKIYNKLDYNVGELNHYVIPNQESSSYQLCVLDKPPQKTPRSGRNYRITKILPAEYEHYIPYNYIKYSSYINNRYINHPVYSYGFLGVINTSSGSTVSLLVTREVRSGQSSALKLVDLFGDDAVFFTASANIHEYLSQTKHEYIDLYTSKTFETSNSTHILNCSKTTKTIIPNYYEPFERRNIAIHYAISGELDDISLYRGDSDQDRPNRLD